jgi:peroxiredoxin
MKQLVQLQADLKEFEAAGLPKVVGISYDCVDELAKFADKSKITFPLLSDAGSKTIAAYGLLNKEAKGKADGTPYPGTMVLDKEGIIRAKLFVGGIIERHSKEALLKATKEIK